MIALIFALILPVQDEKDKDLEALRETWTKIIELSTADKIQDVSKTITGWKLTRDEFTKLFGEEKAKLAYENYEKYWKDVADEAGPDVVKRVKDKKYDTVDVWCLNTVDPKELSSNEKTALESLADKKVKLYSVRLRSKDQKEGYIMQCFVKVADAWRAGFKVGKWLKSDK